MGKRKHRKSQSSPGFIGGKRGNSFDSVFEESSIEHEDEEDEESELDPQIILKTQNSIAESSQLGVDSVDFSEQGDDYPIFNPPLPIPIPISYSQSSSSCNSSISLRLPSSNVSSASNSSTTTNSHSRSSDVKKETDSENDEQLTFPVSNLSQTQQESFLGRVRSLIQSPPQIQAMDRTGEPYDPHRIPAAVFETNKAVEWSTASNESLFSLNLGRTNSLSPEQIWGGDMTRSGELDPMAVYRLANPRASVSDSGHWFQISDVEFDHVLKKIEEHDTSSDEEENGDEKIQSNQTEDDLKQVDNGEDSLRHGDIKVAPVVKGTKNSEESIKSTSSFAFNPSKHSSSIQMPQHELTLEPKVEKGKSKRWFNCCGLSSCSCCSFWSCSSCWPSSKCFRCFGTPRLGGNYGMCSWRKCFCCFRTPRLGGNRFLCC